MLILRDILQVRSAVTEMLDAWVGVASASCVMPDVIEVRTRVLYLSSFEVCNSYL